MPQDNGNLYSEFVESYGNRNSTRLPAYHRLDIGVNKHKIRNTWQSTWSIGAYNLYNRKKPVVCLFVI